MTDDTLSYETTSMKCKIFLSTAFKDVGGYDGMVRQYETAMTNESYRVPNTTCHLPDKNAFRMLREADDDYMPWAGFLLGQTPGSIWYWCADQVLETVKF